MKNIIAEYLVSVSMARKKLNSDIPFKNELLEIIFNHNSGYLNILFNEDKLDEAIEFFLSTLQNAHLPVISDGKSLLRFTNITVQQLQILEKYNLYGNYSKATNAESFI